MPAQTRISEDLFADLSTGDSQAQIRIRQRVEGALPSPPHLWTSEELEGREPPVWFLHRMVPEDGVSVLYGPPKMGKTFLALEWAHCLATGTDWMEYPVYGAVKVLYVPAEGINTIGQRTQALRQDRGIESPRNLKWLPGGRRLFRKDVTSFSRELAELWYAVDTFRPQVIFMDTLARHSPGADVASNHDMQLVWDVFDEIRTAYGTSFVLVHHTTKEGSNFLGAQAVFGSADVMVNLKPQGEGFEIWTESRDWDDHKVPGVFQIRSVDEEKPGWATVGRSSVGVEGLTEKAKAVLVYVAQHPGCGTEEVQEEFWTSGGSNARTMLTQLAKRGVVNGTKNRNKWQWFAVLPEEDE